ncbi:uncharacterized protein LOC123525460 [Mercenaria mercenaria]|uniref:uncharacterized protein LOC123525460 n=1 Tax=Mercenaria mercenaria TaxID=6596 RepID=UPI00234F6345|nr:uncharacterized protein LOC123525460 [Mercenaria mercenaria]
MTNTDQTFLKQRLTEGTQVNGSHGDQQTVCYQFLDLHGDSIFENQDHQLQSLTVVNQEVERSEVTDVERLQQRIRELEATVFLQNREIQNCGVVKRDYEAVLTSLAKRDTEISALREDRERFNNECQFYKLQAEEKTSKCEKYEERIREMNLHRIEDTRKIRDLEGQVRRYKEKCRDEMAERISPRDLLLFPRQEGNPTDSGIGSEQGDSLPKRRRHFRKSLTSLPKCRNCQTVFDQVRPHEITCTFHRVASQPLKAWKSQLNLLDQQLSSLELNSYRFWPCCEKYGIKEPPGCLRLKSHEIIYPEEE